MSAVFLPKTWATVLRVFLFLLPETEADFMSEQYTQPGKRHLDTRHRVLGRLFFVFVFAVVTTFGRPFDYL